METRTQTKEKKSLLNYTKPLKVLLVDDEEVWLMIIKSSLEDKGYHVEIATSGYSAIMKIVNSPPDVVIADIMMPDISGFELISIVKTKYSKKIPFIVMSSLNSKPAIDKVYELGGDFFIQKPVDLDQLIKCISDASDKAK